MVVYNHWQKSQCFVCEHVYDPVVGDESQGVLPETPVLRLPDDWRCPGGCGASKRMYRPLNPE